MNDAVFLAQPTTQVDRPATRGTERVIGPFDPLAAHVPVADRTACLVHRLALPQNSHNPPVSSPGYFVALLDFDGFAELAPSVAGLDSAAGLPPLSAVAAGLLASDSFFSPDLYDSLR